MNLKISDNFNKSYVTISKEETLQNKCIKDNNNSFVNNKKNKKKHT